jgi:hypothetical protein
VSRATHAITRLFRLDHIESVGKQPLHQSGKYRVNKNDEEILRRAWMLRKTKHSRRDQMKTGRAWRGPLVVRKSRRQI